MSLILILLIIYIIADVNYFIRCAFVAITVGFFELRCLITDQTTIYGICTPQDVDIFLWHMNNARFLRELNFASIHFYLQTKLFRSVRQVNGNVVQRAVTLRYRRFIPIFTPYRVTTKLIWWDAKFVYLEQQFVTLWDGFVNAVALSKHHLTNCSVLDIMETYPEILSRPPIPEELRLWLHSIDVSSQKMNPYNNPRDCSFSETIGTT